jgi:hypothetical protein
MRNLSQFPVTREEQIQALEQAKERALAEGGVGSIHPAALQSVLETLKGLPQEGPLVYLIQLAAANPHIPLPELMRSLFPDDEATDG